MITLTTAVKVSNFVRQTTLIFYQEKENELVSVEKEIICLVLVRLFKPTFPLLFCTFVTSVTRLADFLHFGQLFKAFGNN